MLVSWEDTNLWRRKVSLGDIGESLILWGLLKRYWSPEVTLESWRGTGLLRRHWSPEDAMVSWVGNGHMRKQWSPGEAMVTWGGNGLLKKHWSLEEAILASWGGSGLLYTEKIGSTAEDFGLHDLDQISNA